MTEAMLPLGRCAVRALLALIIVTGAALPAPAISQQLHENFVIAVTNDRAADVKAMLARGVDPNTVDEYGQPVLLLAARAGNAETVDVLLAARGLKVNARSKLGDTAFMVACLQGEFDIAKKLRAHGAEVNGTGWTPLIYAATGGHDDIVAWLLRQGADINAVSPNRTSALMMAVRENRMTTVDLLIAKGANVNIRNENNASALDWAKHNNDAKMIEALKRAGAR